MTVPHSVPRASRALVRLAVLLVLCMPAAHRAVAQEVRIGYIDSDRIFKRFKETQEAQRAFDRDLENWTRDATEKKKEIDGLKTELESQTRMLSQAKLEEKQAELAKKQAEYEEFVRDIWGPNGKVARRNEDLTRPIVDKIRQVVERLATEQGYSLIFDAAGGAIVYAGRALDLTDLVIAELDKLQTP